MMTDEITITIPLGDISYNNFDIIDFILCNTGLLIFVKHNIMKRNLRM